MRRAKNLFERIPERENLRRAQQFTRHAEWFLKLDVRKYFDSVPHARLLGLLARRFKDRRLLELLHRIITSYRGQLGVGLPIGSLSRTLHAAFLYRDLDYHRFQHRQVARTWRPGEGEGEKHLNLDRFCNTAKSAKLLALGGVAGALGRATQAARRLA